MGVMGETCLVSDNSRKEESLCFLTLWTSCRLSSNTGGVGDCVGTGTGGCMGVEAGLGSRDMRRKLFFLLSLEDIDLVSAAELLDDLGNLKLAFEAMLLRFFAFSTHRARSNCCSRSLALAPPF